MKLSDLNPLSLRRRVRALEVERAAILDAVAITPNMEQAGVSAGRRITDPAQAYEWHVWSFVCARAIAQAVAMLPLVAKSSTGEAVPLPRDLDQPNHVTGMDEHTELLVLDACMTGNTFELVADDGLWRVNPSRMKVIPDRKTRIGGYEFDAGNGEKLFLNPANVIHRRLPNPNSEFYGLGPGSVALDDVKLDEAMGRYDRQFFEHGSRLGAILETDMELSRAKKHQLAREFNHQFAGVKNAYKTAVASHGLKIREVGETHKDMEFGPGRDRIRDRVAAAYLVPPLLIGDYSDASFANANAQLRVFFLFTVLPMARRIANGWNRNRILFPTAGKAKAAFEEKEIHDMLIDPQVVSAAVSTLYQSGMYGRNKLRAKFFRDPPMDAAEAADVYRPIAGAFGAFPMPAFGAGNPRPPDPSAPPAPDVAAGFDPSVLRRLVREAAKASRTARAATKSDDSQGAPRFRLLEGWDEKAWGDEVTRAQDDGTGALRDRVLVPLFRGQLRAVLDMVEGATELRRSNGVVQLAKAGGVVTLDELIDRLTSTNTDWADALAPEIHDDLILAGQRTFARLGLHPNAFDIRDPELLAWARDRSLQFAHDVNATTSDALRGTFERVMQDGSDVDRLASEIRSTYDAWTGNDGSPMDETRAMRIARTETVAAQNVGTFAGFERSGVVDGKQWLTLGDAVVRASHASLNGTAIGLDEVFPNGLRFPADMEAGASASEIVNCRCTIQPVIME